MYSLVATVRGPSSGLGHEKHTQWSDTMPRICLNVAMWHLFVYKCLNFDLLGIYVRGQGVLTFEENRKGNTLKVLTLDSVKME